MRKLGIAAALALVLAVVGVAAASIAKESYSYHATMTAKQEVPARRACRPRRAASSRRP